MLEVSAIFTRVVMKGSVPGGMSKSADSVLGFFSIRIAIASVFGIALSIWIGTTAPFSAMSGAVIWICALSVDPLPPSAFSVACTLLVSNAALFHCCWAKARPGRTRPASASIPAPPPMWRNFLRLIFIVRRFYRAAGHSERNIVVHVVELARGLLGGLAFTRGDRRLVVVAAARARVAHPRAAAEHLHALGDDLGRVALLAFLVLPLARAQRALDVDLRALLQVLARDLGEAVEEHHAMPLGALLLLAARLVLPLVGGRDRDVGDRAALGGVAGLRIAPEVAYDDDLVDRCHVYPSVNVFRIHLQRHRPGHACWRLQEGITQPVRIRIQRPQTPSGCPRWCARPHGCPRPCRGRHRCSGDTTEFRIV